MPRTSGLAWVPGSASRVGTRGGDAELGAVKGGRNVVGPQRGAKCGGKRRVGRATPTGTRREGGSSGHKAQRLGPGHVTSSWGSERAGGSGSREAPSGAERKSWAARQQPPGRPGWSRPLQDLSRKNVAAAGSPPFKHSLAPPPHPSRGGTSGTAGAQWPPRPPLG